MGTKQIEMQFQVVANDGVSANVVVIVGGVQQFSGAMAQTVAVMPGQVYDDLVPHQAVNFNLDVPNQTFPPGNSQPWHQWTTPVDVQISVSGGDITLQATEANYNLKFDPNVNNFVPGEANVFAECHFNNQPVWTPPAEGRLVYQDNIDTGPGSLLLLDGETCVYQVAMPYYCDSLP